MVDTTVRGVLPRKWEELVVPCPKKLEVGHYMVLGEDGRDRSEMSA